MAKEPLRPRIAEILRDADERRKVRRQRFAEIDAAEVGYVLSAEGKVVEVPAAERTAQSGDRSPRTRSGPFPGNRSGRFAKGSASPRAPEAGETRSDQDDAE
jgi:hypothetical protein